MFNVSCNGASKIFSLTLSAIIYPPSSHIAKDKLLGVLFAEKVSDRLVAAS